jgi:hypothetical protein
MKLAFLPIDNRPVCYTLPKLISEIDESIEFLIPKRDFLGDLTKNADISAIFNWLESLPNNLDAIVLTLDTIAYGGLIPSRRCPESVNEIKERIEKLKEILLRKNCKIYAFSSIMRISNNNFNEEEKEYWSQYVKKIFEYSYNFHKNGKASETSVPKDIIDDYLKTRKRNFEINKIYLEWQKQGLFETLLFTKDDCAQYGLNVMEAEELEKLGGQTKTGADEIPLTLMAKAIQKEVKICPIFLEPEDKKLISNYEDISVENSVKSQIELAGCKISDEQSADILLYVNNFKKHQGEIVMKVETEPFNKTFIAPDKPFMTADVRFANGADNKFVDELFKNNIADENFYGYSAWNTTANTLGSLICGAKIKFHAPKYNSDAFKKLQLTRFLDDWAYQANIRQELSFPDTKILCNKIQKYKKIIENKIGTGEVNINYVYPWKRLFEVEIGII